MADDQIEYQVWVPVIGRALAYMCLHTANMGQGTTAEKASFLEALGLNRKDVAEMLGTSYGSVTELLRQAKNRKKGGKRRGRARR